MKRIATILILSLITLMGCNNVDNNEENNNTINNENNNENNIENVDLKIQDYFPFKEDNKYTYEGEGNEYASYTMFIDYITETRIQTRTNNGGTEMVKVFEHKNGELVELLSLGETYYRQNFTDINIGDGKIILKEPLTKDNNWTSKDGKTTITNVDVEITTPIGDYKALEVTTEGNNYKTINYYAKDVGLVRTVNKGEGYEVSSTLGKIETDTPLVQNITLYYPDLEKDTIYAKNVEISFKTNEGVKDVIHKAIKENKENPILSENASINSLSLMNDGMVYADFSKELVTEMNAGSYYESMILQCITNTLGNYYGADKVYITIDGKPYESGHIQMKEKEPFTVNLQNVKILE